MMELCLCNAEMHLFQGRKCEERRWNTYVPYATQVWRFLLSCLQYNTSHLPRWRRPLVGYSIGVFLIVSSLMLDFIGRSSSMPRPLPGLGLYLDFTTLIIAIFWGLGPSTLVLLASLLAVDYFYIQPTAEALHYDALEDLANIVAFFSAGMLIAIVAHRREAARIRAQINESVAQQSQLQLENFIAIVCHELKTPVTGASGFIQLAQRKLRRYDMVQPQDPNGYQTELIVEVKNSIEHAIKALNVQTRLIDDLLDASRSRTQRIRVDKRPCLLAHIVREVVERQRSVVPTRIIHLELPAKEDDSCVLADPDRIAQVLTNYLTNALKYSPADKPVYVTLRLDDQVAWVLVRDEGPGLPPKEHQRIWERFYRVSGIEVQRNADLSYVSLGVGLYICATIIELHRGQVGMWSQPMAGSTFWFTLSRFQQAE
jgi:signal transduction histidine kinase